MAAAAGVDPYAKGLRVLLRDLPGQPPTVAVSISWALARSAGLTPPYAVGYDATLAVSNLRLDAKPLTKLPLTEAAKQHGEEAVAFVKKNHGHADAGGWREKLKVDTSQLMTAPLGLPGKGQYEAAICFCCGTVLQGGVPLGGFISQKSVDAHRRHGHGSIL